MSSDELATGLEVAIIGLSGRFPGAAGVEAFWRNLCGGVESISFFSAEELVAAGHDPAMVADPAYVRACPVLAESEWFDAAFFGYSPREAELMDPQQRIFLECCWHALEDAGYDPAAFPGAAGLIAGASFNTYLPLHLLGDLRLDGPGYHQLVLGNDKDFLATRVAYKLGLHGPAFTVQSACSTSLLAVHLACQSLISCHCDLALAGGATVYASQQRGYHHQEGGIFSPDGHCRPFDARAAGTVFGSGAGVVVLKRLADALADGDTIRAVLKATAINNDGAQKVGFTAPGVAGQAEVIETALALAGVDPATIGYVETHGTGTALGDPIEIAALTQAFTRRAAAPLPPASCALGSVKSNIGHLDAAAGVASLLKTVLSLERRLLPPSLHFERPNPRIDFAAGPFEVNTELRPWPAGEAPRRAGVSSFGIGGTNVHAILEEAPEQPRTPGRRPAHLLLLSARTLTALDAATAGLARHLAGHPELEAADVAWTLQAGRRAFRHRRILVCRDLADAVSALGEKDLRRAFTALAEHDGRPVAFLFPGQGSQAAGMGRELYRVEPRFREQVDYGCELLRPLLGLDLRTLLFPAAEAAAAASARLRDTALAQPALFVLEHALACLWMEWGIRPRVLLGHSVGEYTAACLAGVLSVDDALHLLAVRGRLLQEMPPGVMLSVPLAEAELAPLLGDGLDLAAVNGPSSCVVAGAETAVAALEAGLAARRIEGRRLQTSHAFHSALVEPALEPFRAAVAGVALQPPRIPFLSNLTGTWITAEQAVDPEYWTAHLRRTVRFSENLWELFRDADLALLEVGPGRALAGLARRHPGAGPERTVLTSLPVEGDGEAESPFILRTLGRLWLAGAAVDWTGLQAGEARRRVPLPTYPFERRRFWVEPRPAAAGGTPAGAAVAPAERPEMADWFHVPSWRLAPAAEGGEARGRHLLFLDGHGLGERLKVQLEAAGCSVATVVPGPAFARLGPASYALPPGRLDGYVSLLDDLRGAGGLPGTVLHLWSVTGEAEAAAPAVQDHGFYSLLFLARALSRLEAGPPLALAVLSDGLHGVTGAERLDPRKATLLGPCRVIPQELPGISCRSLDVVLPGAGPGGGEELERLAGEILAEVHDGGEDPVVALRAGHRWVRTFEPVRLPGGGATGLRERGVYLLTGGLGGVGLALAEHLARTVRARLALLGRTPLPPRAEWVAAARGEGPAAARLRRLLALEAQGAEVLVLAADVTDPAAMRAALGEVRRRFGALHGVFHAAGVSGGGVIPLRTREEAERVLAPKLHGALVLNELLAGEELDALVLFSSLRSVMGGRGHVDYSAANAFLDALAAANARAGGRPPTVSVAWDIWKDAGMSVDAAAGRDGAAEALAAGMSSGEGAEVLERVLARALSRSGGAGRARLPRLLVATRDLAALLERGEDEALAGLLEEIGRQAEARPVHSRPDLGIPCTPPRDDLERALAAIWRDLLGVDPVGVHDDFFELGGDSVIGLQVAARARQAGLELSPHQIYQNPTVAALAAAAGAIRGVAPVAVSAGGPAPLSAIQHWFFAAAPPEPHLWTHRVRLSALPTRDSEVLESALAHLLLHHDALRLRFRRDGTGWLQEHAGPEELAPFFLRVDLRGLDAAAAGRCAAEVAQELPHGLDLQAAPLLRAAFLDLGHRAPAELILALHHLVVDGPSWAVLLEDLETACRGLERWQAPALPPRTAAFASWAAEQAGRARSTELQSALHAWLDGVEGPVPPLPADGPGGDDSVGESRTLSVSFGPGETGALLHDVPRLHRARVDELLVAAVARALTRWSGGSGAWLDVERDGREAAGCDLSRTVGWFTTLHPLRVVPADGPAETVRRVREALRAVPDGGAGFGLPRYLGEDGRLAARLAALPAPEVLFAWLGRLHPAMAAPGRFDFVRGSRERRRHRLEITALVREESLLLHCTWGPAHLLPGTVENLAGKLVEAVTELLAAPGPAAAGDFPEADLSREDLDDILAGLSLT